MRSESFKRIHPETVATLARYQEFLPFLEAGLQNGDVSKVREIAAAIESHEPGNFVTQWYAAQADLRDGDTESAAAHMDAVGICPGEDDEGNSLIEHVAWATIFAPHQASAIKRGIPSTTFYRWYDRYQAFSEVVLEDRTSGPGRVWNRIPDNIRQRIVEMASARYVLAWPSNSSSCEVVLGSRPMPSMS